MPMPENGETNTFQNIDHIIEADAAISLLSLFE